MFLFKKKEKNSLFIRVKDVFSIIRSDYDNGYAFCLIEFNLYNKLFTMGSVLIPNTESKKENIYFVFDDNRYDTYEEFAYNACINGLKLSDSDAIIEILRAGIIDGDAAIKTPWGDTRLAKYAITN